LKNSVSTPQKAQEGLAARTWNPHFGIHLFKGERISNSHLPLSEKRAVEDSQ
jgi:hypothetical protein